MRSKEEVLNEILVALKDTKIEQAAVPILLAVLPEIFLDIRDLLNRYVDISEKAMNKSMEVIDVNEKRLQELTKEVSKPENEGK